MSSLSKHIANMSPLKLALASQQLGSKRELLNAEPIAIIGMGCRFPGGADNPELFWQLLTNGMDAITEIPSQRWIIDEYYDSDPEVPHKMYTRYGGFLKQVDSFDAQFFGISPREMVNLDPQQRLLMEVSWEAIENANQIPHRLSGSTTGVFVGISSNDYSFQQLKNLNNMDAYFPSGYASSVAAGRLSYNLGLNGPCMAVDTACSSSLVAVHLACQSLRQRECEQALVGGVNLILAPELYIAFSKAKMLSPDGRCKTFDMAANGYVRGEGCGVVILKRLIDAVNQGDNIVALIRGSSINHDGHSSGLTVPNGPSQQTVIRQALDNSGIEPDQIGYIETHGTGTSLGDPIEVIALGEVFKKRTQPLFIGSVKTNIGHLESAAGIAGLIKTVLALQHEKIPPHLHFKQPNSHIPWDKIPVVVPTEETPWHGQRRMAGVSSFGFSGTNAHVVLEAPDPPKPNAQKLSSMNRPVHLLTLSAKTPEALTELAGKYKQYLSQHPDLDSGDICFTANTCRTHFKHRMGIRGQTSLQLQENLAISGNLEKISTNPLKIAFLFTGQGSQYVGMGQQLYETQPEFRKTLEHCDEVLRPYLETPLLEVLYAKDAKDKSDLLNLTTYTQPALFALEYALAQLWQSWGIQPSVVMGHSVGQYVAACVAGVFTLEEGLKLIAKRANLMHSLSQKGEMVVVFADEAQVIAALEPYSQLVSIAALNEPNNVVISGELETIQVIVTAFEKNGIETRKLQVSHAFHSPLIEPILDRFEQTAKQISFQLPKIPLISNLTGKILEQIPDANYWRDHTRNPVQFMRGMQTLFEQGYECFLEIGPKPVLSKLGQGCQPSTASLTWLPSLKQKQADWHVLLNSLSTLYVQGAKINWTVYDKDYSRCRVSSLPTYPFQRKRYWIHQENPAMPQTKLTMENPETKLAMKNSVITKNFSKTEMTEQSVKDAILETLCTLIAEQLQIPPTELEIEQPLLEMGADSIIIGQVVRKIEATFGVTFTIKQIFEELNTLEALTSYIEQQAPVDKLRAYLPQEKPVPQTIVEDKIVEDVAVMNGSQPNETKVATYGNAAPDTVLGQIMSQQLQVMSHQLEVLRSSGPSIGLSQTAFQTSLENQKVANKQPIENKQLKTKIPKSNSPLPPWQITEIRAQGLTPQQQHHLEALIARYTQRTPKSKQLTQQNRPALADSRASAGFRMSTKEMLYPIVGERAQGAKTWDIDGNEYIDITMGFGVNLFGHHPPFILEALEQQLQKTMQLGLQTPLAGQVAHLICELTGMERVTFCNTGTEAVMTALRLARTATNRNKIVQFTMSYHGHFDGTLGEAQAEPETRCAIPIAPGITPNTVADTWVLDYGKPQSLELIRAYADELAAVLVEPVQSRRPDLQPKAFLQQLRQLTLELNIPLIFDEMITGFRIHPGGAQAWFGVQADIATYGKIVGGGMPIGIVAGKASYMDGIDGGFWNYGDASYPQVNTTFFAGTFGKHPLAMATALAVLQQIKQQGPALQERLNQRTTYLVDTLNDYFETQEMPIRLVHFASLFRFTYSKNLDLLYYHLLEKGIYVWEGRNCFLSTAHTDEDIEYLIKAVKDSVDELSQGGFLPPPKGPTPPKKAKKKPTLPAIEWKTDSSVNEKIHQVPLTEAQKQLWVLANIQDEGSLAYNTSLVLELRGNLNLSAIDQAVQQVVSRHEALRTIISRVGDFQQILPSLSIKVPLVDLSENSAQEWLKQESCKTFNLSQGPLIRVYVVKLEEDRHLLVLTSHHSVVDGLSLSLLIQEMGTFYSAACQGITCQFEAPLQFRDYMEWQTQQAQTSKMAKHEAYWLDKFSDSVPVLNLPTDYPYPSIRSYRGNKQTVRLPVKLYNELKVLSQKQGCTLFMALLAAYTIWLYRVTRQNHILVGIPVGGRNFKGSENLVGYCTHLLPITTYIEGPETFLAYLKTIRSTLLEAYEHQDYPFAHLINKLNLRRDTTHTPIVSVTFNLDKFSELPELFGLEVEWFSSPLQFTAFDLTINFIDMADEIVLDYSYNTDLFNANTIEHFVEQFQVLLEGIVSDSMQTLSQLPLLTKGELQQLQVCNQTPTDFPEDQTIVDLFQARVEKTPENIAVMFEDQQLTYEELNRVANQLAHYLMSLGLFNKPETLVGICVDRSIEMVIGLLGILKAGGAYVPLDPDYPKERLQFILKNSEVKVLLTQSFLLKRLPVSTAKVIALDSQQEQIGDFSSENLPIQSTPRNLAYVIYTSGSTGVPKGVMIEHRSLVNFMSYMAQKIRLKSTDKLLAVTTLSFDISALELYLPLISGSQTVIINQETANNGEILIQKLAKEQITIMQATPATWKLLLQSGWNQRTPLTILCGGEALPGKLGQSLLKNSQQLWNVYGPTETTIWSTIHNATQYPEKPELIGKPIANTQIYILDGNQNLVPPGITGELCIGGKGLARGYFNRPELTSEKFIEIEIFGKRQRIYKTGDLARWLPDHNTNDYNLEYLGRLDHQVKIRGFRIELGEIEVVLGQYPSVQDSAVIVHEVQKTDQRIIAYLVLKGGAKNDNIENLREFLKNRLPDYMIPSAFVVLEAMPLTPNGKIDRRALPQLKGHNLQSEVPSVMPQTKMEHHIAQIWQQLLQIEKVGIYDNFFDLGGHSLLMVQAQNELSTLLKRSISTVELFQYPTIHTLARHLTQGEIKENTNILKTKSSSKDIAIIGMSGRFPGAKDIDRFWQNLHDGVESITFFSDEELSDINPDLLNHPNYVRAKGTLEDIELFDAAFFDYSPREAEIQDPQQRVFLECAWSAIEDAGYDVERLQGPVSIYAGIGMNYYLLKNLSLHHGLDKYQLFINNDKDFLPTRVCYKLNLQGPGVNVQTACSTSLVAVHLACQSLLNNECDMALAGGVALDLPQQEGYLYQEEMIGSPDGHCRPFDARAQGTLTGNGLGIVVLKKLDQAMVDKDYIHAVIKGSAINNDGSLKVGYTAPSVEGQARVIASAMGDIDYETITYIEAHGTATSLGDPIEIAALTQAYKSHTDKKGYCAIGSVKSNIGHLDTAAGIAGLIKTVLALEHTEIPPSLHFEKPNPRIDFANSPFYVNSKLSEWKTSNDIPRRAGVSSFGIGGTNAHVVVEEAPVVSEQLSGNTYLPRYLLVLSAKTATALEQATTNLAGYLTQHPNINLANVAYTLSLGRKVLEYRRVLVCRTRDDAIEALNLLEPKRVFTQRQGIKEQPVVFMFSGQGSQYVNMASGLYQQEPLFREQIDKCAEILKPHLNLDLRNLLYPSTEKVAEATQKLEQTAITQPALFVLEYALVQLWMAWGLRPVAMIGHSIGEYVAACLAKVFTLEDALILVAKRGQLMQSQPQGAMLSVPLEESKIQPLLNDELSLAAHNGPSQCVISGTSKAITKLQEQLTAQGVECRLLKTSHAFHSRMMEPVMMSFVEQVKQIRLHPPQIPYLSNLSGTWITTEDATDPDYWAKHLRQTVRFAEGLQELLKKPEYILLEIGPGRTLSTLARRHPDKVNEQVTLSSVRHPEESQEDVAFILTSLGQLWLTGVSINWLGFYAHRQGQRVPLPTYPFERQRYWIDSPTEEDIRTSEQPLKKSDIADWFYLPVWQQSISPIPKEKLDSFNSFNWLVFEDSCGLSSQLVQKLKQVGQKVITVTNGAKFSQLNDHAYVLNPQKPDDYHTLFAKLSTGNQIPQVIIHLWTVTPNELPSSRLEYLDRIQDLGFYSLLFIAQALGKQEITREISIEVISNHIHAVTSEEVLYPEKATLLGAVKIIPQEYPNIRCRNIDVVYSETKSNKLVEQLWAELMNQSSEVMVAYRGLYRWVPTFKATHLEEPHENTRLRKEGVYLITGGFGGIGLTFAEYLAKTLRVKLILTGRSSLPPRSEWDQWLATHEEQDKVSLKLRTVQNLENMGAKVLVTNADVANLEQMQRVITHGKQQFGQINGVIHCAGIIDEGGIIARRTREMTESVLAPKVKGTLILDNLLKECELDFFVLCSSISSIVYQPTFGEVGYCAANDFLDAFAYYKTLVNGTFTISINWSGWQEVGMAVTAMNKLFARSTYTDEQAQSLLKKDKAMALLPSQGVDAFRRILETTYPQVVVSTQDPILMIEHYRTFTVGELKSGQDNIQLLTHQRPELNNTYVAPRDDLEEEVTIIFQQLLGIEQIGIYDDFMDLGGDSLLATQLISKIRENFDVVLPLASFFENATIAQISERILTKQLEQLDSEELEQLVSDIQVNQALPISREGEGRAVSHPLFDECLIESGKEDRYISHLSVKHWVLNDHRIIMGKAVLPGTAYLELARAAFEHYARSGMVEIRDTYFLHPLIVEDDENKEVHTVMKKQGEGFEFVISTPSGQEHARGVIGSTPVQPDKKHDIKNIEDKCDQPKMFIDTETQLSQQFGPRWYNLQWFKLGNDEGLAFLELPQNFVVDLTAYKLHPALLDVAVGFLGMPGQFQGIFPFSYKRLTIKAPLPAKIYSHVRYKDMQKKMFQFNVTLMDEQGLELVDIEEYTVR